MQPRRGLTTGGKEPGGGSRSKRGGKRGVLPSQTAETKGG